MTKITFKDLPDTSTPLNASNLNTLQDNVENAISVVAGDIPTIDSSVSTSSTNPVENQAITNYVDTKGIYASGGTQDNGYIKYDNGTMICWQRKIITPVVATADGAFYRSDIIALDAYAQEFYNYPTVNLSFSDNTWTMLGIGRTASNSVVSKTSAGSIFVYRGASTGTGFVTMTIHVIAIGRWKA